MPISLSELNQLNSDAFVAICGPFFEHSSWVAERTFSKRPFSTREVLHQALCSSLHSATETEKIALIAAHPDLVGSAAIAETLTAESNREQAAAGLGHLTVDEIGLFQRYNREYRERFGFPFVICARENKKTAILTAFPLRLMNSREQEIQTALAEIEKIAWLRLGDAISEG